MPVWWYLNIFHIYKIIFSQQKYIVCYISLILYCIFLSMRFFTKLRNRGEHGTERWATGWDISKIFNRRNLNASGVTNKNASAGGMIIKKIGNRIWHEKEAIHSLIIGTTSSGKTRKTLIPSIMVASNANTTKKYRILFVILKKEQYLRYVKRHGKLDNIAVKGVYPYRVVHSILKKLFHLRDKQVLSINDSYDIKRYYHYENMKDVHFSYSKKGNKIDIDDNYVASMKKLGKCKLDITITIEGESFFVNDPKRELYSLYKIYLEKKGYNVILLDLRNNDQGDCWNPITIVIKALKEGNKELADMYANDIATALCPESRMSEKIWTDGERAVIAAVILAVAGADCDDSMKNLYSCYQILLTLGQAKDDDSVPLNDYMNSLPIGDIARSAFGPAALATDRTRMSFFVSAAATLHLFSNLKVAKQTARSTFDNSKFSNEKTAVFLVVPDEKLNMNGLGSLFIDECYRVLVMQANKTFGSLYRRFHFFIDEFSNLNEISGFSQKLTISRGRNCIWHLYVQDYSMIEKTYGKEVLNTIKANCNLTIYISTQSYETAEDISKRIGNKTIETQSVSHNNVGSAFVNEAGSVTHSLIGRALLDVNELMQLPNGKAVVLRLRCHPILTTLPDCSTYDFYNHLEITHNVATRDDPDLEVYVPFRQETSSKVAVRKKL